MKAKDIKKGFQSPWWTARGDARLYSEMGGEEVMIAVTYPDGGNGIRVFDPEQDVEGEY